MEPAIKYGALVIIENPSPEDIKVGDIIAFKVPAMDMPVVHRVTELINNGNGIGYRTKGDANYKPDDWLVKPDNLIGRVILNMPWLGHIAKFVKSSSGFGLLIGLPAVAIIALELSGVFSSKHTRRKRLRPREKSSRLPIILVITTGLVMIGVLWGLMTANAQEKTLGSIALVHNDADQTLYLARRSIQNEGIFPLIICLTSSDETLVFTEEHFWVSPGQQKEIGISGNNDSAIIRIGGFFPMLPEGALYTLFRWNSLFAPLIVGTVWILPLTIGAIIIVRWFRSDVKTVNTAQYLKSMRGNA